MKKEISEFQKRCYNNYLNELIEKGLVPKQYLFPFGNPIRPVIPTKTAINGIMLIGAFPSARFEVVDKMLIPCANNLSPFGEEEYFDGMQIRVQESRRRLNENYFTKLNIDSDKIWLTDIVKVYLYPDKHIKNCIKVNPSINYVNTHKIFYKIAIASMKYLVEEIRICSPKLIITLGEIPARVLTGDKKKNNDDLLNGSVITKNIEGNNYNIAHLAHPEICRINKAWMNKTEMALINLGKYILQNKLNA
ncbi:MAG: hypothetical protein Q8M94_14060 [Ignavibacteria bacterium]|nr:hypothetical protein [Ignavibacteria bacterium]